MGLRAQIEIDVGMAIENPQDVGVALVLTDPDGVDTDLFGHSGDISTAIDPDSGMLIKGKRLHVNLRISSLPPGPRPQVQDSLALKPWRVSFKRITTGVSTQYKVIGTVPDDSVGSLICELGEWNSGA